ncbi:MAG: hypothetical protein ACJA1T_000486 [Zhongshania aliphaticivorans]
MNAVVIDTNVLLVANEQHEQASPECVFTCVQKLLWAQQHGVVVIDDAYRIISEYYNKPDINGTRTGDAFLKWLLQNQSNTDRVHQVLITETNPDHFVEFPDQALQPDFDAPDRKFPAVANAHHNKPPILQAADCKWLNWWLALHATGITVDFVCPVDICGFYRKKFPDQPPATLPYET